MKCLPTANARLILAMSALFPAALAAHNHEAAENKVRDRVGVVAADYVDTDVRLRLFMTKAAKPTSVFQPVLTVNPGYATNPSLAPDGAGAYFLGSALAFGYDRRDAEQNTVWSVGYEVSGLFFESEADENNEVDQVLSVAYQRKLACGTQLKFGVSDTQVDVDYTGLLNVAAAGFDVRMPMGDNLVAGFAYTHQVREALLPVSLARRDPDAVRRVPAILLGTDLSRYGSGLPQVTVTYANYWNLADGADEDFEARRVALRAANWRLSEGVTADLDASYEDRAGENFSSRFVGLMRREDVLTRANVTLNHRMPVFRDVPVSLSVGYERSESNLTSANYDGWTFAYSFVKAF